MKRSYVFENSFQKCFMSILDPRIDNFNKKHLLIDVLIISICAIICKCETWEEIADFGKFKLSWFKNFLELPNGIPSHDTFRRIFMLISPSDFNKAFIKWTELMRNKTGRDIIPFDGKSLRGSSSTELSLKAIHIVSAWSTNNGIILGQIKTEDKSNEITAIPKLIDLLDIKDSIVTIDAMGCQKEIASKIIDNGGDYILALKNNQKSFFQRTEAAFEHGLESDFKDMDYDFYQERNIGHGRVEERNYFQINDINFLNREDDWKSLSAIGMVESITIRDKKVSIEKRFYIMSISNDVKEFGDAVRKHWQVENNLHWKLDVQFNDDASKKRERNSADNFSILKRAAMNLLKKNGPSDWRNSKKRMYASYDENFLKDIIMGKKPKAP